MTEDKPRARNKDIAVKCPDGLVHSIRSTQPDALLEQLQKGVAIPMAIGCYVTAYVSNVSDTSPSTDLSKVTCLKCLCNMDL